MKCLHCRKEISIAASICPWCHQETQTTKTYQIFVVGLGTVFSVVGFFVAGFVGAIVAGLFGMVIGFILARLGLKRTH